ncbi:MAG: gluconate 2-dehydrogenase subunit 3 family protein [Sinobacteraceae bacterium]|nr:gluconate 2-dehydrogenase subunit 3 family protein [Nevskiaceae bacterium]
MSERYPGYDVLAKRDSPSWNEQTRAVIDKRVSLDPTSHRFFTDTEWPTMLAICSRIIPQANTRARPVPLAAMIDEKLFENHGDGYRDARLPPLREAWRRALLALDAESQRAYGARFHELPPLSQDDLLRAVQAGKSSDPAWGDMPPALFFAKRLLHDIVTAYYAHPVAWNEIGFGGPAAPRGYVRMDFDRRDPWEAAEAHPGLEEQARRENARIG